MTGDATILISWLAWFALLYQVYLQRTHNEKSLKPLGQIDLEDRQGHLYVRVTNNGLGPMLVDRLRFTKAGKSYSAIDDCLELDKRSYTRIPVSESVRKVILPHSSLTVFETRFDEHEAEATTDYARKELSAISLRVEGRDIYDNKINLERSFHWFSRYLPSKID